MTHCYCVGTHKPDCPNAGKPDSLPPLKPDKGDKKNGKGK